MLKRFLPALAGALAALALAFLPREAAALDLAYATVVSGVPEPELRSVLEEASSLRALESRPPATLAGLERRAETDTQALTELLRSEGYYAGSVAYRIEAGATPVEVALEVTPGPLFLIGDVAVRLEGAPPEAYALRFDLARLGLEPGAPARAEAILDAERKLVTELGRHGYPLAQAGERDVVVDHRLYAVSVTFVVRTGPFSRFGKAVVEGLEKVDVAYVNRRIAWQEGDPYDTDAVEKTRRALMQSRLFASVKITHADAPDATGHLPIKISVVESDHRVIGAGVGYSTDEGVGGRLSWEHRNLFGKAERLKTTLAGTERRRRAMTDFVKPDLFGRRNSLVANVTARDENLEAFDSRSLEGSLGIERELLETLVGSVALSLERTLDEENEGVRGFTLVGFPLTLKRDTTDDLLDPTRGGRTILTVTPYTADLSFVVARLKDSFYRALTPGGGVVAAFWGSIGTIRGEPTPSIPPDKRFFAGGGGSIRGYGLQLVGPLDAGNKPLGGRSIIEAGTELRLRLTDDIGIVPFVEVGSVSDSSTPDFGEKFFWSTGLGLRYYTDFGPLRLDVAFPLDRRTAVDDAFQIYVSLGQAF